MRVSLKQYCFSTCVCVCRIPWLSIHVWFEGSVLYENLWWWILWRWWWSLLNKWIACSNIPFFSLLHRQIHKSEVKKNIVFMVDCLFFFTVVIIIFTLIHKFSVSPPLIVLLSGSTISAKRKTNEIRGKSPHHHQLDIYWNIFFIVIAFWVS